MTRRIDMNIKDIMIKAVFLVIGAIIGALISNPFAELESTGKIYNDTLVLDMINTNPFVESGRIKIFGILDNNDTLIKELPSLSYYDGINTYNITVGIKYINQSQIIQRTTEGTPYIIISENQILSQNLLYRIECEKCRDRKLWEEPINIRRTGGMFYYGLNEFSIEIPLYYWIKMIK